jgi:hypothetical protein
MLSDKHHAHVPLRIHIKVYKPLYANIHTVGTTGSLVITVTGKNKLNSHLTVLQNYILNCPSLLFYSQFKNAVRPMILTLINVDSE